MIRNRRNDGFAGGNNVALREVRTPLVALLNNDARPEPDWLTALSDAAAEADIVAGGDVQQVDHAFDVDALRHRRIQLARLELAGALAIEHAAKLVLIEQFRQAVAILEIPALPADATSIP